MVGRSEYVQEEGNSLAWEAGGVGRKSNGRPTEGG